VAGADDGKKKDAPVVPAEPVAGADDGKKKDAPVAPAESVAGADDGKKKDAPVAPAEPVAGPDDGKKKALPAVPDVADPYDLNGRRKDSTDRSLPPPPPPKPSERTQLDHTKVLHGEGYWDVAARMLGFTNEHTNLHDRRVFVQKNLTGHDRAQIYNLMEHLRKSNNDNFMSTKLHYGQALRRPHGK